MHESALINYYLVFIYLKSAMIMSRFISSCLGVESVALKGDDMRQIEVMGDGVDAVALTTSLRKKVGYAEVVSVGAAGAGDQSMDDEKIEANPEPVVWPNYHVAAPLPHYDVCVVRDYDPYGCSIL